VLRELVQCPYSQGSEVALPDSLDVVLKPDANSPQPCPHLIWVEGRYSQCGLSPLPGRKTKIARMVGSTEFEWLHPSLDARHDTEQLRTFLKDLVGAGSGWEFAPSEGHSVRPISVDQKITDASGKEYPRWEIEGTAVFAGGSGRSTRVYRLAWFDRMPPGRTCLARLLRELLAYLARAGMSWDIVTNCGLDCTLPRQAAGRRPSTPRAFLRPQRSCGQLATQGNDLALLALRAGRPSPWRTVQGILS
jgi:hypothetical protein